MRVPWSKLKLTTSGRSLARRMPSIAAVASSRAKNVSSTSRSAPPAASPRACSSYVAAHSSRVSVPERLAELTGWTERACDEHMPVGGLARKLDRALVHLDGAPGERRVGAGERLSPRTCTVRIRSAPAATNARCSPTTRSGCRTATLPGRRPARDRAPGSSCRSPRRRSAHRVRRAARRTDVIVGTLSHIHPFSLSPAPLAGAARYEALRTARSRSPSSPASG